MPSLRALTIVLAAMAFLAGYAASFKPVLTSRISESSGYVEVWVARKELSTWSRLNAPEEDLKRVIYRQGEQPSGAVVVGAFPLKGRCIVIGLQSDEPLRERNLYAGDHPEPAGALALRTFPVSENSPELNAFVKERYSWNPILRPGVQVDVIGIVPGDSGKEKAEILLEDVALVGLEWPWNSSGPYIEANGTIGITRDQVKRLDEVLSRKQALTVVPCLTRAPIGRTFDPKSESLITPKKKEVPPTIGPLGFFSHMYELATKEK